MTTVAKRYDVSSNYLARICERLKVPRPARGYWQQKAAGQDVEPEELPPLDPGDETAWRRGHDYYTRTAAPPPVFTGIGPRKRRRDERPKTHPLLVGVRDDFLDTHERKYDNDGYLKPKSHALPDIFVSKEALNPALDLANRLFLLLEDEGHWVRAAADFNYSRPTLEHREGSNLRETYGSRPWSPAQPTLVFIGGVALGLVLFEVAEYAEVTMEEGEWVRAPSNRATELLRQTASWRLSKRFLPSGRLGLLGYSPYRRGAWENKWQESKAGELKKLLPSVVAELESAAPKVAELADAAERKAQEEHRAYEAQQREERRKELAKLRTKAKDDSREDLLGIVSRWVTACNIERFFTSLEGAALSEEERRVMKARIGAARELFGGTNAVEHFDEWGSPEEFFQQAKKGLWWRGDDE